MGDELRSILRKTDGSAAGIQGSAGIMMRHYDKSATVAVTEWRNTLQNATKDQLLPLLYVANEVLQTSKRNRGTKFLEAFGPILEQSLQYICQAEETLTEKVRRTTKIWADRRVFSVRYVNDLLKALEPYRDGNGSKKALKPDHPDPKFSPDPDLQPPLSIDQDDSSSSTSTSSMKDEPLQKPAFGLNNDNDDDESSSSSSQPEGLLHLDLDVTIVDLEKKRQKPNVTSTLKRRRSSTAVQIPRTQKRKRRSVLSTTSLMELWNQTSSLQQNLEQSMAILSATVTPQHLDTNEAAIESLVGDELLDNYKQCTKAQKTLTEQRRVLHGIAEERHSLEKECMNYIPWLRLTQKQDEDDLNLSKELEDKLVKLKMVHADAKASRGERNQHNADLERKAAEEAILKKQEEERRKLMEDAMKRETEAKPGMVWNRDTREYQYPNTDESWRD